MIATELAVGTLPVLLVASVLAALYIRSGRESRTRKSWTSRTPSVTGTLPLRSGSTNGSVSARKREPVQLFRVVDQPIDWQERGWL